ncbi:hypothetical protein [Methanocella arvoryzae]|uniref:Uncharacterized protein n=1 Tax=Methanocella arvoryzae (strain DSM 22066 / NBRC 105507 / MRE50) TaxID=351160 RepID=Q0W3J4_METAR|nr:hypothetical protein [Methanocella arvoryzae]CAJ37049.1 hypothetical protein RCIX1874 [Methanocella arvoryzae MRE50]
MKSMEHRLWFLLFVTLGNGLVVLLLLLHSIEPAISLWSMPFRYILIGPAIATAYLFALAVAVSSLLIPAMADGYLLRLKKRLISPTWLIWSMARLILSLILIVTMDMIWIGIALYYSLSSQHVALDTFINSFGLLLGIMNLILVGKVFLVYIYGHMSSKWPVVLLDGLASLIIALVLACVILISPFDGLLPFSIVLLMRVIMGGFCILQATDAAARITRAFEYRFAEKSLQEDVCWYEPAGYNAS